jgi:hypothetical protein
VNEDSDGTPGEASDELLSSTNAIAAIGPIPVIANNE